MESLNREKIFVHPTSIIDDNVEIGEGTKIWHFCHIQSGAKIGRDCTLGQNVNVSNNAVIGNGVKIQNNVSVYEGVELEDYVFCGPSCVFTNDLTPRARYPKGHKYKKTVIKHDATLGANCTIICGHTVGEFATVAAGAVVSKDVEAYALVAGVPARRIGWVCECGQVLDEEFRCPDCGKQQIRRCIFHIPNALDKSESSGSQIRPRRMLEAFKSIGYEVDIIMGYGKDRKKQIKKIKEKVKKGIKYDFLYSESSTMPTLFTEKNHIPVYPFLDFGFFKFCKKNSIPIGLFYRDIHWKFPIYAENVKGLKYYAAQIAYRYDLVQYCRYLDAFYLPSKKMDIYIRKKKLSTIIYDLPPACVLNHDFMNQKKVFFSDRLKNFDGKINLLYVGGIGNDFYILDALLEGISELEMVYMTICCRKDEWEKTKPRLDGLLTNRITIVHDTGRDLEKYYKCADICAVYLKPNRYADMAVPVKLFEYIAHITPVLACNDTYSGEMVQEWGIGWSIKYDAMDVKKLLLSLVNNYSEVFEKHLATLLAAEKNSWLERAEQVSSNLTVK